MLALFSLLSLFFAVVSQSMMDLAGTIFVLFTLYSFYKNKERVFDFKLVLKSNYFILFYGWVFWILISFLLGASNYEHLLERTLEFRWILYVLAFLYILPRLEKKLFFYSALVLGAICFLSFHIYVTNKNYLTGENYGDHILRVGGPLNDPMTFAHGIGLLVMFLVGYFAKMKSLLNKYIILSICIMLVAVLMTLTRGVWIAVIASFAVYFFIQSWRHVILFFTAVLVLGISGYVFSSTFRSRIDQAIQFKTSYDTERVVLWETNWYMFKNNPVFGIGYGENKHRIREFYDILNVPVGQFEGNAHNQFLNFLAGTGIVGLIFYLAWIFTNLYWAFRLFRNPMVSLQEQALGFGSFLAQIVFVVGGLTESNFEHSKIKTIVSFFWAISFYSYYISETKQNIAK